MNIDYTYVRTKKSELLKEMHNNEFVNRENLSFDNFCDALILPAKKDGKMPFGLGGVITNEEEYVLKSGIDERFGGYYKGASVQYEDAKVVYCGYLINHWGHFLIESVARLWYFLKDDISVDKYIFVTDLDNQAEVKENYKSFFELLGIYDKLEVVNKPTRYREVIVPELGYKRNEYYSEEYREIFGVIRRKALTTKDMYDGCPEKIFLSRRFFAEKTEVGVDMLDDFFLRNDYYVLYPEKVSLSELICFLDCAKICAAESGTLPHNFLFANDEKKIIIIERQDTINEIQVDVDKIKQLQVTYIDGFYTIYPVGAGYGPYYLAYNEYMCKYAQDNALLAPSPQYLLEKYTRTCVAKYMRIYRRNYGYKWAIENGNYRIFHFIMNLILIRANILESIFRGEKFLN